MKFNVNDLAGIKKASIKQIEKVEKDALVRKNSLEIKNQEDVEYAKWLEEVLFKCDRELKDRGAREKKDWEKMFN